MIYMVLSLRMDMIPWATCPISCLFREFHELGILCIVLLPGAYERKSHGLLCNDKFI
jgi:hypothetical protein